MMGSREGGHGGRHTKARGDDRKSIKTRSKSCMGARVCTQRGGVVAKGRGWVEVRIKVKIS